MSCRIDCAKDGSLEQRLIEHVLGCEALLRVMSAAEEMALPDWYLVAGALAQSVWNIVLGRPVLHKVEDIDVVYFDSDDLTEAMEGCREATLAERLADIGIRLDAKNQARVHLWYEKRFGYKLRPYRSTREAITTFPFTATSVGVTGVGEAIRVFAPFGLDDLFNLTVRANRTQITPETYTAKAERVRVRWPEITILPWEAGCGGQLGAGRSLASRDNPLGDFSGQNCAR